MSNVHVLLSYAINSNEGWEWTFHGVYPDKEAAATQGEKVPCHLTAVIIESKVGVDYLMDLNSTHRSPLSP